jgi:hypothetical protein
MAERRKIDDGEAGVSETELTTGVRVRLYDYGTGIVGAAMREGPHGILKDAIWEFASSRKRSKDSTHVYEPNM